jgi:hypothetical protein
LWECFGKSLRREVFGSSFDLHRSVSLICATAPAVRSARGYFA